MTLGNLLTDTSTQPWSFFQQTRQYGPGQSFNRHANTAPVILPADTSTWSCPQQSDHRLSGPPSGQGTGGGARTRDIRVPADLKADSLATVPPTPPTIVCRTLDYLASNYVITVLYCIDCRKGGWVLYIASPQQGDLRLLGPPSGRDADGGGRTRDRRVPADLRVDSVPPTPPIVVKSDEKYTIVTWSFAGIFFNGTYES
ncbi:hypothetical protein PoB_004038200 [Plakobranchus ocellatus]|uniref:Uncharacterized protein n=1 Tax=Plakobranchus ocellatus TaxID=259542 RepID=A0AAV4B418_9GAST|nr:hypothetical protein PoB_004038200 [Plakobranchus ocellatus]